MFEWGGREVCEGGGSVAGEARKREGACEGGEEGGDDGARTAACTVLASRRPAVDAPANPQMSWSQSPTCASMSLVVFVSVCRLLCESVCPLGRCVFVHPQQETPECLSASVGLKRHLASGGESLRP